MTWGNYLPYHPVTDRPLSEVSRKNALAAFTHLMEVRHHRIEQLHNLLRSNGIELHDLEELDAWFVQNVQAGPNDDGRLSGWWYGVVLDIALYLSELLIEMSGGSLRWEMVDRPKSDISYQRPVLRGFNVANKKHYADLAYALGVHGHRIVAGEEVEPELLQRMVDGSKDKMH